MIKTNRLTIRKFTVEDIDDFYSYRSNPDVTIFQGFDVMNKKQAREFIENEIIKTDNTPGIWNQYGIEEINKFKIIGDCAILLERDDPRIAQIGITLNPEFQGKGLAKEAMVGLINYLFKEKGLHRIKEIVDVENLNSIKLLESLNFRKEGHFIENIFFNGKWGSEFQYALLYNEWNK